MASIAVKDADVQALRLRIQQLEQRERELEQEKRDLKADYQSSERHARRLQDELDYHHRVFRVSGNVLSPAQKITLICARKAVRELRYDDTMRTEIYTSKIGDQAGVSRDTVRRDLIVLMKSDVLTYETERERLDSGAFRTHSYVTLLPLAEHPENIVREEPRKLGGARVKCERCGSEQVDVLTVHHCRSCDGFYEHSCSTWQERLADEASVLAESEPEPQDQQVPLDDDAIVPSVSPCEPQQHEPVVVTSAPVPSSIPSVIPLKSVLFRRQATHAAPDTGCRFCQIRQWIWSGEDHDWICLQCYSPASGEVKL